MKLIYSFTILLILSCNLNIVNESYQLVKVSNYTAGVSILTPNNWKHISSVDPIIYAIDTSQINKIGPGFTLVELEANYSRDSMIILNLQDLGNSFTDVTELTSTEIGDIVDCKNENTEIVVVSYNVKHTKVASVLAFYFVETGHPKTYLLTFVIEYAELNRYNNLIKEIVKSFKIEPN